MLLLIQDELHQFKGCIVIIVYEIQGCYILLKMCIRWVRKIQNILVNKGIINGQI